MSKGPTPSPELIADVRRCAEDGLTLGATAAELTTPARQLSRSSIAGIAHRNAIKFTPKASTGPRKQRKPPQPKIKDPLLTALQHVSRPNFATVSSTRPFIKPPQSRCSWADCASRAEPGDMFCHSHGRKGLMA